MLFYGEYFYGFSKSEVKKTFSQKQNKKKHSKTQLDKKNLSFHYALFLYFSNACQGAFALIKDDSNEGL